MKRGRGRKGGGKKTVIASPMKSGPGFGNMRGKGRKKSSGKSRC